MDWPSLGATMTAFSASFTAPNELTAPAITSDFEQRMPPFGLPSPRLLAEATRFSLPVLQKYMEAWGAGGDSPSWLEAIAKPERGRYQRLRGVIPPPCPNAWASPKLSRPCATRG